MLTGPGRSANPPNVLSVLRRIRNRPPADPSVATCDMCAEPIADDHPHVVDIQSRQLMCTWARYIAGEPMVVPLMRDAG